LNGRPERSEVHHRVEEAVEAEDEKVPRTHSDRTGNHLAPARQHHQRGGNHRQRVEGGEDNRKRQPAADVDIIRGLVGVLEFVEDAGFLAEILGYRNPADRFFDGGIHVRHRAHALAGGIARHLAVNQRQHQHDGDQDKNIKR